MAEGVRFELTERYQRSPVFKTGGLNRSPNLPKIGSLSWNRTKINGTKNRCPTVRRKGTSYQSYKLEIIDRLSRGLSALLLCQRIPHDDGI